MTSLPSDKYSHASVTPRFEDRPVQSEPRVRATISQNLPQDPLEATQQTMKDYSNHFRDLIELQIPDDSRILVPRGGQDMIILVSWRLKNDDFRPSKRSRMIRIVISEEALQDYAAGTDGVRLASDARLVSWLKRQLDKYNPDHDAPLGVEPPPVTWTLATFELNG
jgi:hypothetical protein